MATRIQLRRGTSAQWTAANPILASGEIGIELDTFQWKVGDGTTAWADRPYVASGTVTLPEGGDLDDVPDGILYKKLQAAFATAINGETFDAASVLNAGIGGAAKSVLGSAIDDIAISGIFIMYDEALGPFPGYTTVIISSVADGTSKLQVAFRQSTTLPQMAVRVMVDSTWYSWVMFDNVQAALNAGADKAAPVDADTFAVLDSEASNVIKKFTWANLKAKVLAAFGVQVAALTAKSPPTDADMVAIADSAASNASRKVTFTAIWAWVQGKIHGAANKATIVDADKFAIVDTEASNATKTTTWSNIKAKIWAALGGLIAGGTGKDTPIDADTLPLSDSAAAGATKKLTFANLKIWVLAAIGKVNAAVGFTLSGGTTSKTFVVSADGDSKDIPTAAGKTAADGLGTAGIVGVATRGVEDSTKVIPATGADVAALLAAGGYLTVFDGVTWDEATDTYTRIGRATTDPNYLKVQRGMRRCVLAADGTVAYYLCPTNSALKEDGVTASVLDGTDGNVMVEIPKFYIDYSYVGTLHTWKISEHPLPGFDLHPLFLSDTTELDKAYIGAFEAVLYDVSLSKHVSGNGVEAGAAEFSDVDNSITCAGLTAPFENITVGQEITISGTVSNNGTKVVATVESAQKITVTTALVTESAASCTIDTTKDTTNDKLASVSGFSPITKITRANARKMASNIGTGWTQETFDMASAVQLLYLIEYGTFYSQDPAGPNLLGITGVRDWAAYNNSYPIAKTGNSVGVGNATANTGGSNSAATEVSKHLTYRGIENPFGHIWKWIDGFNVNANVGYVCNNPTNFADGTSSNYTLVGTMPSSNGYQNTLLPTIRGFLPKTVGSPGDSDDQITDYYYQSTGWRVSSLGGDSSNGASAGFFCWNLYNSSANSDRFIGARLGFRK